MNPNAIGIDFGTTNSSVARVNAAGEVELAEFRHLDGITDSYRSLLYLERVKERGVNALRSWTGSEGIEHYLAADTKGRLIQSLKSFLSSHSFRDTDVFYRSRCSLEDLIARILRDLREKAKSDNLEIKLSQQSLGGLYSLSSAEVGEDNSYAEERLKKSFQMAGFESVEFELEPVAAAQYYESTLDHDELILIGDFGGGTSDFSLIHVGPAIRRRGRKPSDLLGNAGVGMAGDAFDAKIIRHLVSPALGAGTQIRSMGRLLPVPTWVYAKLDRWNHVSFLIAYYVMKMLN